MKRRYLIVTLICLMFIAIASIIGVCVYNSAFGNKKAKEEKIVKSCIYISVLKESGAVTLKDAYISDEKLREYQKIINSEEIRNQVKDKYSNVRGVELEKTKDGTAIYVIYVLDGNSEVDCVNINNLYVEKFGQYMSKTSNYKVTILEAPSVTVRNIIDEKKN